MEVPKLDKITSVKQKRQKIHLVVYFLVENEPVLTIRV